MKGRHRGADLRHGPTAAGVLAFLVAMVVSAGTPPIAPSTPPVVDVRMLDPGNEWRETSNLVEDRPYAFDASRTTDDSLPRPEDNVNLTFRWDFGDGTVLGPGKGGAPGFLLNVTHAYADSGIDYRFNLTVTDTAGEIGWLIRTMVVQVNVSAHPDLSIVGNLSMMPTKPRQGSPVQFSLDVMNAPGRKEARSLNVALFVVSSGPDSNQTISGPQWFDRSGDPTSMLLPGETATVRFTWIVPTVGDIFLKIRVWDLDEPSVWIGGTNQFSFSMDAGPALAQDPIGGGTVVAAATTAALACLFVGLRRLDRRRPNR